MVAKAVIDSLQQESLPHEGALETAEAACEKLLAGVASCASEEGREAAEKALKGTLMCITTLQSSGAASDDVMLINLEQR